MRIILKCKALLREIANIAYVTADVEQGLRDAHSLHQTFDICEEDNVERVRSLMALAYAEAADALRALTVPLSPATILNDSHRLNVMRFVFRRGVVATATVLSIREAVREFIIARCLHGWLGVTLPEKAPFWEKRAADILRQLQSIPPRLTARPRRLSPF